MTGTELCWWPARTVAAEIAAKRLSAREYLAAQRDRIAKYDGDLGYVVTFDERADDMARQADEAVVHGNPLGPLHGVAMTVKDSLSTKGLRTTGGTPDFADNFPAEDAQVVAAVRRAGAIVFGKTNLPEYAADVQTNSPLFPVARNPWNPDYTPGGSSGGSAGAVAAGFSPVELGSDVAGSIRLPAAHCGIAGHKPSFGIVPMLGHIPYPRKYTAPDMSVIGPLARSVPDLALLLDIIAGPGPLDQPGWQLSLPGARPIRRVAAWFDDAYCPVDAEVQAALMAAAQALSQDGIQVDVGTPAQLGLDISLAASDEVFRRMLTAAASGGYPPERLAAIAAGTASAGAELGAQFIAQRQREWGAANEQRAQMRLRWQEFFTVYDAILLPVAPNLVPQHDDRPFEVRDIVVNEQSRPYWDQIVWAGLTGVSYLPGTVVPVGLDSRGLPLGVAIAGAFLEDKTTLAVAERLSLLVPPLPVPAYVD
ncbi:amidase family protein [Actinocrispum sp. NPDC049592]|uniref:amidase family protein n=1 Tax=Actinocrispum sp. NPDC049592 TaxID=3154835 RepID=UPI00343926EF